MCDVGPRAPVTATTERALAIWEVDRLCFVTHTRGRLKDESGLAKEPDVLEALRFAVAEYNVDCGEEGAGAPLTITVRPTVRLISAPTADKDGRLTVKRRTSLEVEVEAADQRALDEMALLRLSEVFPQLDDVDDPVGLVRQAAGQ